ncbi:MAG: hypothetical protein J6Z80_02705, partial [Clostridia bacterium]|nr:hypothetical protein [Clostridia bacterium]
MSKNPIRKKIRYWLDRRMAKGTASMVKLLLLAVLFMVVLVTVLVIVFKLNGSDKNPIALLWDNMRSAMSSSFPSSDSGPLLYIVLYTLIGLTGMIFTGMLIGIFSTSMRGKILALQKDNPEVIEKDHTVILGFRRGEYALLDQMIRAAGGQKRTIVVVENMERQDMEQMIRTNVKVPKKIRMIVIKTDTTSAAGLSCCTVPMCSTVVINTREKGRTVKTLLAVEQLLRGAERRPVIVTAVDTDETLFPEDLLRNRQVSMLHSGNIAARIVAHAATQPGIFDAFMDMLNFENFEFYFEDRQEWSGLPFGKAVISAENGVIVGLYRGGDVLLNPEPGSIIERGDLFVVFEEEPGDLSFTGETDAEIPDEKPLPAPPSVPEIVIFGVNSAIRTVIRELPDNIERIKFIGLSRNEYNSGVSEIKCETSELIPDFRNSDSVGTLTEMVRDASHVVILSDRGKSDEAADTETMIRIIRLRNIKKKYGLGFSITAEMRCENNRRLIVRDVTDDFIVASDLSSMMLAQVTEDTRRLPLFRELLDESGSELYLRPASELGIGGKDIGVKELRRDVYAFGYILLGIRTEEDPFMVLDDEKTVRLGDSDRL